MLYGCADRPGASPSRAGRREWFLLAVVAVPRLRPAVPAVATSLAVLVRPRRVINYLLEEPPCCVCSPPFSSWLVRLSRRLKATPAAEVVGAVGWVAGWVDVAGVVDLAGCRAAKRR